VSPGARTRIVSLLQGPQTRHWQFRTDWPSPRAAGGAVRPPDGSLVPSPGYVSDVIGHSATEVSWVPDSSAGWISATDIGGGVGRVASLATRFRARRACMPDSTAIWFLDDRSRGLIYRRETPAPFVLDSVSVPNAWRARFVEEWDSVRFAERGGPRATDGNTVDLYGRTGRPTRTIRLSRGMALRIARSDRGLFALRTHKDTVLLARYPLPTELLERAPQSDSMVVAPPPEGTIIVDTTKRKPIVLQRPRGMKP
jgi:hypothetical protein